MKRKKLFFILFLLYIVVIFRITVFRNGFRFHNLFQNGDLNLTLFLEYIPLIQNKDWYRFIYLFAGNIVWFLPFGVYLQYAGKLRNIFWITLSGFIFSLMIETLQYVFGTGHSELDDLILNTFGVWAGAMSMKKFRRSNG